MTIADFLSAADVAVDVRATDKSRLLKELSSRAAAALNLSAEAVAEEIEKRGLQGSAAACRFRTHAFAR